MRQIFKQRIVGAVVLVALAVIFVPFLFTLEPPRPIDTASQIPPAPDIEPVIVAGPERGEGMAPPKPPEEAFLPLNTVVAGESATPVDGGADADVEAASRVTEQERQQADSAAQPPAQEAPPAATDTVAERPALADNTLASWVVQVASVRDQAAANALRDKLQAAGHKAYVRDAIAAGSTTYRVFVGPVALKERAVAEKESIDKAFRVESLVMRFEP